MFKKLLTLVVAVSFLATAAQANTNNGLKTAFDELNYSLSVEWNQKDMNFKQAQVQKFSESVKALGLNNQDITNFALSQVKDAQSKKDLAQALSVASKMSPEQAADYVVSVANKAYNVGSSWNGAGSVFYTVLIVLLLLGAVGGGYVVIAPGCSYGYSYYYCGADIYGDPGYCCY